MRYLFDTDHLSILQRQTGDSYVNLMSRLSKHSLSDFGVSIVSFHEQCIGAHAYINHQRNLDNLVQGYDRLEMILDHFRALPIVPFDRSAVAVLSELLQQRVRG